MASSAQPVASAGSDVAGQLAAASQACADALQNGYPGVGIDQVGHEYAQWSAEAGLEGDQPLAAELAKVAVDGAAANTDELNGRDAAGDLITYEQAASAVIAHCTGGA